MLVGSQISDPFGRTNAGTTYVIFGHRGNETSFIDIDLNTDISSSNIGFKVTQYYNAH